MKNLLFTPFLLFYFYHRSVFQQSGTLGNDGVARFQTIGHYVAMSVVIGHNLHTRCFGDTVNYLEDENLVLNIESGFLRNYYRSSQYDGRDSLLP